MENKRKVAKAESRALLEAAIIIVETAESKEKAIEAIKRLKQSLDEKEKPNEAPEK